MGGLLAADIALVFRHRLIGVINFDVPFLGMHPGIVKAGLGSIFKPWPEPQDATISDSGPGPSKTLSRMGTLFNPKPSDPNYNPSFANDVQLPVRKGWENSIHWLSKHYKDGLREATKGLVKSHLEFGGAMADYRELKDRYAKVRALEEEDEQKRLSAYPQSRSVPRIRFVNYYTASTGRPKKPKSPKSPSPSRPSSLHQQERHTNHSTPALHLDVEPEQFLDTLQYQDTQRSASVASSQHSLMHVHPDPIADTPRVSIEVQEHRGDQVIPVQVQEPLSATSPVVTFSSNDIAAESGGPPNLPEIPPVPQEPPFVDLMQFSDKAQRRAAEKEHDQALKEYQKAVKTRNKIINERTKIEEKWEKAKEKRRVDTAQKQAEKEREDAKKEAKKEKKQTEIDWREVEKEQRRKEQEQRRFEEESRRIGSSKAGEKSEAPSGSTELEDSVRAMDLSDQEPPPKLSQAPYGNYTFSRSVIMDQSPPDDRQSLAESGYTLSTMDSQNSHQTPEPESNSPPKKKKLKKFCMLPPKDGSGNKDPTWVRVFMEGVDEVTAHTTLFFISETYEKLVGDVGARIEDWVREADSMRLIREMEGLS